LAFLVVFETDAEMPFWEVTAPFWDGAELPFAIIVLSGDLVASTGFPLVIGLGCNPISTSLGWTFLKEKKSNLNVSVRKSYNNFFLIL